MARGGEREGGASASRLVHELLAEGEELLAFERLREEVSPVVVRRDERDDELLRLDHVTHVEVAALDVLRALVMGVEAMRVEVGHLRSEQATQRDLLASIKQQRARLNRHVGTSATRAGGVSVSRPPDSRMGRRAAAGAAATPATAPAAGAPPMREHFEA